MYRILKNGFTTCGRVYMSGDVIDDTTALAKGLYDWYEKTQGIKRGEKVVERIEKEVQTVVEIPSPARVETTMIKELPSFADALQVKGYSLEEALKWEWKEKAKKLGVTLAKKVNDYGKSSNNK